MPGFAEYFHIQWPTGLIPGYPRKPLPSKTRGEAYNLDEYIYPTSKFPEVYGKIEEVLKKYGIWDGFPPIKPIYDGYPMKRQVVSSQTWIRIKEHDPYWFKQLHDCQDEIREWYIQKGGMYQQRLPPLIPKSCWDVQMGAFNLAKSIKQALDPNNILSPGIYDFRGDAR